MDEIKTSKLEVIIKALDRHGGNKTRAAKDLGMGLTTLRAWVKREEGLRDWRVVPYRDKNFHKGELMRRYPDREDL